MQWWIYADQKQFMHFLDFTARGKEILDLTHKQY